MVLQKLIPALFLVAMTACAGKPKQDDGSATPAKCQPVTCELACPNGFAKDADGCEVCQCAPGSEQTACEPVTCDLHCPSGWAKDDKGCDICQCAQ